MSELINTSGFYKLDGDGALLYAAKSVNAPDYTLTIENKAAYNYPIEGWIFAESENIAREYFNLPMIEDRAQEFNQFAFYPSPFGGY